VLPARIFLATPSIELEVFDTMLRYMLLCVEALACYGAPSWPVAYSYSPDSLPIIQVRLAPPNKQMPEVSATLGQLDAARVQFETEQLLEVEAAYKASWDEAAEQLPQLIDRLMHAFKEPTALVSHKHLTNDSRVAGLQATAFREAHDGRHELSARFNILPVVSPVASVESRIKDMERKRSKDEGHLFSQAISEMRALTQIVQNEVEAMITRQANNFLHSVVDSLPRNIASKGASVGFLSSRQPVLASGTQLTTNVRVMASDEPFQTIASMVEDLERDRDAGEGLIRSRLFEMQLKLLQAENDLVKQHLGGWIQRIM